jgi:phosphoribosylanthranilate isomerase
MSRPLVKICGTTSRADALLAQEAGADFVGIVLDHAPSPRCVRLQEAPQVLEGVAIPLVALSVNQPLEWHERARQVLEPHTARLILQLHGDEEPELVCELTQRGAQVWVAIGEGGDEGWARAQRMREAGAAAVVMDARVQSPGGVVYGGTGQRGDWKLAARLVQDGARVVLAGGLGPENVREAIDAVQPWAVDVASGVEERKGLKNAPRVREFVRQARAYGKNPIDPEHVAESPKYGA